MTHPGLRNGKSPLGDTFICISLLIEVRICQLLMISYCSISSWSPSLDLIIQQQHRKKFIYTMSNGCINANRVRNTASSANVSIPTARADSLPTVLEDLRLDVLQLSKPEQPTSTILQLPPEIRVTIYEAFLLDYHGSTSLLQTCRLVEMEAHKVLYRRPSFFDSQAKLFAWIHTSRVQNLNRVRTITLRLSDVDLNTLLDQQRLTRHTRTSIWALYREELEQLEWSLSALPNLSTLTIVPPKIGCSQLLKNMYHIFLSEIPRRCPKLRQLEIHDSNDLLLSVPALKGVSGVRLLAPKSETNVKLENDHHHDLGVGSSSDLATVKKGASQLANPAALNVRHGRTQYLDEKREKRDQTG